MEKKFELSSRQCGLALNGGITVLIPWPEYYLGVYGSGIFDGSPVSPEACDRVMDKYIAETMSLPIAENNKARISGGKHDGQNGMQLVVTSIIAGMAKRDGKIVPAITVRIMSLMAAVSGYTMSSKRTEWIDGKGCK